MSGCFFSGFVDTLSIGVAGPPWYRFVVGGSDDVFACSVGDLYISVLDTSTVH